MKKNYRKTNLDQMLYQLFSEVCSGADLDKAVKDAKRTYRMIRTDEAFDDLLIYQTIPR